MMRSRPKDLPPPPPQPRIIVGYDSEWVRERKGRNRILSYQLVVLNADTHADVLHLHRAERSVASTP